MATRGSAAAFVLRIFACCLLIQTSRAGSCSHLNNCNGYGACDAVNSRCLCYNGFGSETDIAIYKAPDCSARACAARLLADLRSRADCLRGAATASPHTRRHMPV
jgi:hypothetical protein